MARLELSDTTIKDFSGGWNVADSDKNLSSKYQPISENIMRGVDGSFFPRWGTDLYSDFATGTETTTTPSITVTTLIAAQYVTINHAAHGYASGDHVTISGVSAPVGGTPADQINGTNGILVTGAGTYRIPVRTPPTSAVTSGAFAATITRDTHVVGGNIIYDTYFNRRLIVFTDIGEVGTVDANGTIANIWNYPKADALTAGLMPSQRCDHWSSDNFKKTVIACNGYNKDKPLQITDAFVCTFLVDKATLSNAFVPKADFVLCMQGYVLFIRTEYGAPFLEISAKNTDGTFTRDPSPADSVEIDLSAKSSTVEPVLLGATRIREKVLVAFYDRSMVGQLGIYVSTAHEPDFDDTIAEHGSVSHRTMVSLGNDIFMCDYAGVPSVSISQQSGVYLPVRLSELISPALSRHLANLSEDTLRKKAFAVFAKSDRTYMLFLPKYDEVLQTLQTDPFLFNDELRALNQCLVVAENHKLIERSDVTIAGSTAIGTLGAGLINGVREVVTVVDDDTFIVQLGGAPTSADTTSGGGAACTFTPVNDETIVYGFEYNKEFRTRRWTRLRGWNFDCGCISQRGTAFFCKGKKVYRMGNNEVPLHADFLNDYDDRTWVNNHAYALDRRVRDASNGIVYKAMVAHTSPVAGTFAAYRAANLDVWAEYEGEAIWWELETPWSDMKTSGKNKINKYIGITSSGTDEFYISGFTNYIRRNPQTYAIEPVREMSMAAGDTGGYGQSFSQTWGSGRRTREQKLWPFELRGKVLRWRFWGRTKRRVRITALTMYYKMGGFR